MARSTSIMSMAELINVAFGDPELNVAHHKDIEAVLYILARKLKLLGRYVHVNFGSIGTERIESSSSLSVTEVKVHAKGHKHEKKEKAPTYEKILVVERVPSDQPKTRAAPPKSMVTQDRYQALLSKIRKLQERFAKTDEAPPVSEDSQLMNKIRKESSITGGVAGMQLSARLEAVEKKVNEMQAAVTDLTGKTQSTNMNAKDDMKVLFDDSGEKKLTESLKQSKGKRQSIESRGAISQASVAMSIPLSILDIEEDFDIDGTEIDVEENKDRVTYQELEAATREITDELMQLVNSKTTRVKINADSTLKLANKLDMRIDASLNFGSSMNDLEISVSKYAEKINSIDALLSKEMTYYQDDLTQMQYKLEVGLEVMGEMLANTGCDVTVIAELNGHFNDLQVDLDTMMLRQTELKEVQNRYSMDLTRLRQQIDKLIQYKCSREEVVDALRDKAGIGALNGLVSIQQYAAVKGDLEKRIGSAYDMFNNQEIIWQKAIDDLTRELNDKADTILLNYLRDEINYYMERQKMQVQDIQNIVGKPDKVILSRRVYRHTECLSCSNAAHDPDEKDTDATDLKSKEPSAKGAGNHKPDKHGDHGSCFPDLPISHPMDPRGKVCPRWCGGAHTKISNTVSRVPQGAIVKGVSRIITTEFGLDGKMYAVDDTKKPCSQCHITKPKMTPVPSEVLEGEIEQASYSGLDMTSESPPLVKEEVDEQEKEKKEEEKEALEDH